MFATVSGFRAVYCRPPLGSWSRFSCPPLIAVNYSKIHPRSSFVKINSFKHFMSFCSCLLESQQNLFCINWYADLLLMNWLNYNFDYILTVVILLAETRLQFVYEPKHSCTMASFWKFTACQRKQRKEKKKEKKIKEPMKRNKKLQINKTRKNQNHKTHEEGNSGENTSVCVCVCVSRHNSTNNQTNWAESAIKHTVVSHDLRLLVHGAIHMLQLRNIRQVPNNAERGQRPHDVITWLSSRLAAEIIRADGDMFLWCCALTE